MLNGEWEEGKRVKPASQQASQAIEKDPREPPTLARESRGDRYYAMKRLR